MKILKIFLSRIVLFGLLILCQAIWIGFLTTTLVTSYHWLETLMFLMSLVVVLWLVNKEEVTAYKISWIIIILVVPLFGGLLYLSIGNKKPSRRLRNKLQSSLDMIEGHMILDL